MQISDASLKYLDEEHFCPHCKQKLSLCQAPPFHVGDGLGWGSELLFICLNDDCPLFANSWQQFEEQYGHSASCRYMLTPGNQKGEPMMVGSKDAFTGSVVDPQAILKGNKRYAREKECLAQLDSCVACKNLEPVLDLLLDENANMESRHKACDLLAELNDLSCIDPIRNHKFRRTELEQKVNLAISQLLKANYSKECAHCAEIIKAQAKRCKHCNEET